MEKQTNDMVNSPAHYKLEGLSIESVDVIRAVLGQEGYRAWCKGNALKYLFRAGKKGLEDGDLKKRLKFLEWQDLKKARKFLDWEIESLEREKREEGRW